MQHKTTLNKIFYLFLIVFVLFDWGYSFFQYSLIPLDGDMAESVLPVDVLKPLMDDPLGISTIYNGQEYHHKPNRFFAHYSCYSFFRTVPLVLQKITDPISSVYYSCAIAKLLMQILLTYLICACISGSTKIFTRTFILIAAIITPFFQTNGFNNYFGIISRSITYSFFYALPLIFLLIYFLPILIKTFHGKDINLWLPVKLLWIPLAVVVSLSGALNPGISLIISMLIMLHLFIRYYPKNKPITFFNKIAIVLKRIPGNYWYYLIPICIFSLYSLYLGTYNSGEFWEEMSLGERYLRLPKGLFYILTTKIWFFYLLILFVINIILINKNKTGYDKKILKICKWTGIFIIIYILLLPLGGYRSYRPYIIRHDTFVPVSVCFVFLIGLTTYYLFKIKKVKTWYYIPVVVVLAAFSIADKPYPDTDNSCEKESLQKIASSDEKIVVLDNSCDVLSWGPIVKPEDSYANAQLLVVWNIIPEIKLYVNYYE
ncbi:MAG: hypothetical protein LBQ22_10905 [Bacteroidales bacterium]|jgi:hypothetical protein|nr:hypothetical protein [Bacteroidales bacterium]